MTGRPVVAITGATGFFGAEMVAALAREGAKIRVLARSAARHELWHDSDLEIFRGSLAEPDALEQLVADVDTVVHAAGLIKARDRASFLAVNRDGTRAIAEATHRCAPSARFIAISSLVAREPQLSEYAASKRAGEEAARATFQDATDRLVIVRPPAIYGPGDRATLSLFKAASCRLVPVFGSGRVALVHVADAAAAVARLAMGAGAAGLYALADSNPGGYSLKDIMVLAASALGNGKPRLVRVPDGALRIAGGASDWLARLHGGAPIFTSGKVREMLHPDWSVAPTELVPDSIYEPQIGIVEGFRDTVEWYRTARWLPQRRV